MDKIWSLLIKFIKFELIFLFFFVLFADVVGIIYSLCFTCCWYNACLSHSDIGTRVIFNFEGFHDLIDCFIIIKFYISFFFSNAIRNGFCFRCFHFVSFVNTSLLLLGWSKELLTKIYVFNLLIKKKIYVFNLSILLQRQDIDLLKMQMLRRILLKNLHFVQ